MRDDAWHEDAYDRDDPRVDEARDAVDARYGLRDPHENRWEGLDLLVGWGFAMLAIAVVAVLHGILTAFVSDGMGSPMIGVVIAPMALLYGAPVVTLYGVPVAALAATVLRPVRAEWVHLAVFALLGLIGCWLFEIAMHAMAGGSGGDGGWTVTTAAYGIAAAVAGRVLAKRCAIRRFDGRRRLGAGAR